MTEARTIKKELSTGTLTLEHVNDSFTAEVTFGFTTIDRRHTAFEAVRTLRRHFPKNRLIVIDQNEPDIESRTFYAAQNVEVRFVEYDIGLSAARNLMFRACQTHYFFMLDDDVVEIPHEEMRRSFDLIHADHRVLVVGGRYCKLSLKEDGAVVRKINPPFNNFLFRKADAQLALLFDPGSFDGMPTPKYDADESFRIADVVENFALFNVAKYRELNLSWDDEIKIVAEHLDFYFNTHEKRNACTESLIVANPRMIAFDVDAVTDSSMAEYRKKRYRQVFRAHYARKWKIATEMHLGKWVNIHWRDGRFNSIKWSELKAFGERQKFEYRKAGEDNILLHGKYPVGNKRISFVATTVDRIDAIQALAISIRARFGDTVEILLGLQCEALPEGFAELAHALNVRLVPLAYDIGLSAARNRLVEHVTTEYFVLADDDFIIDRAFHIGNAVRILDNEPDVTGVGGYCRDILYNESMSLDKRVDNFHCYYLAYEAYTKTLIQVPFYHVPCSEAFSGERGAFPVDMIMNFGLFRSKEFGMNRLFWDERMKITGEHRDFYLKNLMVDKRTFLFDPGLSVLHNRVANSAYKKKRSRTDGIALFYEKWDIQFEIDSELGVRAPCRGETRWRDIPGI